MRKKTLFNMYSSSNNSSKDESSNAHYIYQFILFVCWAIVYGNTDKAVYDALGVGEFYTLAECIVWGTTAIISAVIVLSVIGIMGEHFKLDCCIVIAGGGGLIGLIGLLGIVVTNFVLMCIICSNDIHHYFIGYKTFWRERAFNYSLLSTNHTVGHPIVSPGEVVEYPSAIWPYEMSDIIVRIHWGVIFASIILIAFIGGIGLIAWVTSSIKSLCCRCSSDD